MAEVKRILVVDDHFRILDSVRELLEESSSAYEVIGVPSAEEGILEISRESVDLLITDVYLPGMSGGELIVRANNLWPDLPIIVITGHAEKMGAAEAEEAGIVHYFKKPLDPGAFLAAVRSVVADEDAGQNTIITDDQHDSGTDRAREIQICMENLRDDIDAREIFLATRDGEVLYATGGFESALSNLAESMATKIRATLQLAMELGSDSPTTLQYISGSQFELFFTNAGVDHFLAILYYAQFRKRKIDPVWLRTQKAIDRLLFILLGEKAHPHSVEPSVQPESIPAHDLTDTASFDTPDGAEDVEEQSIPTATVPDHLITMATELPDVDEAVDLDAFWDEAVADALDEDGRSSGLTYDEARKMGLIPSEFEGEDGSSG
jgi:DNA-binding response OmpR family regulator